MTEKSKEKTAFTVPGHGSFHFNVMPFGLANAAQTQQRLMDKLFGAKYEPNICSYLDDIICVSETFEEHIGLLMLIHKTLKEANLTINYDKSKFFCDSVKYLGYVLGREGLQTDPDKVKDMLNYKRPTTTTEVKRFLGLCSWYRRFIPHFSTLVAPLNALLKGLGKRKPIKWNQEAEEAFVKIKETLVSAPILTTPDFSLPFTIQSDASNVGVGAVLTQVQEGGEKVIAYASRTLSKAERNYSTGEKEMLALLFAIERFRCYVEGVRFTAITDHSSLRFLSNWKDPTGRIARWAVKLQQFDVEIRYRKGKQNVVADALSRAFDEVKPETPVFPQINFIDIKQEDWENDKFYLQLKEKILKDPEAYKEFKINPSQRQR